MVCSDQFDRRRSVWCRSAVSWREHTVRENRVRLRRAATRGARERAPVAVRLCYALQSRSAGAAQQALLLGCRAGRADDELERHRIGRHHAAATVEQRWRTAAVSVDHSHRAAVPVLESTTVCRTNETTARRLAALGRSARSHAALYRMYASSRSRLERSKTSIIRISTANEQTNIDNFGCSINQTNIIGVSGISCVASQLSLQRWRARRQSARSGAVRCRCRAGAV